MRIWDASTETDFDGWQLRYVEKLPVDSDDRAVLVTVERGRELRKVYVPREFGRRLHARFIAAAAELDT